jgi:hypothetical protein
VRGNFLPDSGQAPAAASAAMRATSSTVTTMMGWSRPPTASPRSAVGGADAGALVVVERLVESSGNALLDAEHPVTVSIQATPVSRLSTGPALRLNRVLEVGHVDTVFRQDPVHGGDAQPVQLVAVVH